MIPTSDYGQTATLTDKAKLLTDSTQRVEFGYSLDQQRAIFDVLSRHIAATLTVSSLKNYYEDNYISVDGMENGEYRLKISWMPQAGQSTPPDQTAIQIKDIFIEDVNYFKTADLNNDSHVDSKDLNILRGLLGNSKEFQTLCVTFSGTDQQYYYATKENGMYVFYTAQQDRYQAEPDNTTVKFKSEDSKTHEIVIRTYKISEDTQGTISLAEIDRRNLNQDNIIEDLNTVEARIAAFLHNNTDKTITLDSIRDALMRFNLTPEQLAMADLDNNSFINSEDMYIMTAVKNLVEYVLKNTDKVAGIVDAEVVVTADGTIHIFDGSSAHNLLKTFTPSGAMYEYATDGKLTRFVDEAGNFVTYECNETGTTVYKSALNETTRYDTDGRLVERVIPGSVDLDYTYQVIGGNLTQIAAGYANVGGSEDFSNTATIAKRWVTTGDGVYDFNDGSFDLVRPVKDYRVETLKERYPQDPNAVKSVDIYYNFEPSTAGSQFNENWNTKTIRFWVDQNNWVDFGKISSSCLNAGTKTITVSAGGYTALITLDTITAGVKPTVVHAEISQGSTVIFTYDTNTDPQDMDKKSLVNTGVYNIPVTNKVNESKESWSAGISFDAASGQIYEATITPYYTYQGSYTDKFIDTNTMSVTCAIAPRGDVWPYDTTPYIVTYHFTTDSQGEYSLDRVDITYSRPGMFDTIWMPGCDYASGLAVTHESAQPVSLVSSTYSTTGWTLNGDFDVQVDIKDLVTTAYRAAGADPSKWLGGLLEVQDAGNPDVYAKIGVINDSNWKFLGAYKTSGTVALAGGQTATGEFNTVRIVRENGILSMLAWAPRQGAWITIASGVNFNTNPVVVKMTMNNENHTYYDNNNYEYSLDMNMSIDNFKVNKGQIAYATGAMPLVSEIKTFDDQGRVISYIDLKGETHTYTYSNGGKTVTEKVDDRVIAEKTVDSQNRLTDVWEYDDSRSVYDGTYKGGASAVYSTARNGNYLKRDGTKISYIDCGKITEDFSEGFTFSGWVYNDGTNGTIFKMGNRGTLSSYGYTYEAESDAVTVALNNTSPAAWGDLQFSVLKGVYNDAQTTVTAPQVIERNKWVYIAVSVDRTGKVKMYRSTTGLPQDLVELATDKPSTHSPGGIVRDEWYVGRDIILPTYDYDIVGPTMPPSFSLDDIGIYSQSYNSVNDMKKIMGASLTGKQEAAVLYYTFDRDAGTATTVKDLEPIKHTAYTYDVNGAVTKHVYSPLESTFVYKVNGQLDHYVDERGRTYTAQQYIDETGKPEIVLSSEGNVGIDSASGGSTYYAAQLYDGLNDIPGNGWTAPTISANNPESATGLILNMGQEKTLSAIDITHGLAAPPAYLGDFEVYYAGGYTTGTFSYDLASGECPLGFVTGSSNATNTENRFNIVEASFSINSPDSVNAFAGDLLQPVYLEHEIEALENATLSFDWVATIGMGLSLEVDGVMVTQTSNYGYAYFNSWQNSRWEVSGWEHVTLDLAKGKHTIRWVQTERWYQEYNNQLTLIKDINFSNVKERVWEKTENLHFVNDVNDANIVDNHVIVRTEGQNLYQLAFTPITTDAIALKLRDKGTSVIINEVSVKGIENTNLIDAATALDTGIDHLNTYNRTVTYDAVRLQAGSSDFNLHQDASQLVIDSGTQKEFMLSYTNDTITGVSGHYDINGIGTANGDGIFDLKDTDYFNVLFEENQHGADKLGLLAIGDVNGDGTINVSDITDYNDYVLNNKNNFKDSDIYRFYDALGTTSTVYDITQLKYKNTAGLKFGNASDWEQVSGAWRTTYDPRSIRGQSVEFTLNVSEDGYYDLGLMARNPYQTNWSGDPATSRIEVDIYVDNDGTGYKVNPLKNIDIRGKIVTMPDYDINYGTVYLKKGSNDIKLFVSDPDGYAEAGSISDRFTIGHSGATVSTGRDIGLELLKVFVQTSGYNDLLDADGDGHVAADINPENYFSSWTVSATSTEPIFSAVRVGTMVYGLRESGDYIFFDYANTFEPPCYKDPNESIWTVTLTQLISATNDGRYAVTKKDGFITVFKLPSVINAEGVKSFSINNHFYYIRTEGARYQITDGTPGSEVYVDAQGNVTLDGVMYHLDYATLTLEPIANVSSEGVLILDNVLYGYIWKDEKLNILLDGEEYSIRKKIMLGLANCTFTQEGTSYKLSWRSRYDDSLMEAVATEVAPGTFTANVDGLFYEFKVSDIKDVVSFDNGVELEVIVENEVPVLKNTFQERSKTLTGGHTLEIYRLDNATMERASTDGRLVYVLDTRVKPSVEQFKNNLIAAVGDYSPMAGLKAYLTGLTDTTAITSLEQLVRTIIDHATGTDGFTDVNLINILTGLGITDTTVLHDVLNSFIENSDENYRDYLVHLASTFSVISSRSIEDTLTDLLTVSEGGLKEYIYQLVLDRSVKGSMPVANALSALKLAAGADTALFTYLSNDPGLLAMTNASTLVSYLRDHASVQTGYSLDDLVSALLAARYIDGPNAIALLDFGPLVITNSASVIQHLNFKASALTKFTTNDVLMAALKIGLLDFTSHGISSLNDLIATVKANATTA
ncbi:MAG: hypothetical protein PHT32_01245 [Candidatus Omnitrophica bacterium]|nr:hypothetical protein [Candidatus Omnitrophota bacterium]